MRPPLPPPIELTWPGGLRIGLSPWGASWWTCHVPLDPSHAGPRPAPGRSRQVLLPPAVDADGRPQPRAYLGVTVGRVANRIAHGRLRLPDGGLRQLTLGHGEKHQLHGGPEGWDDRLWQLTHHQPISASFALSSPDGDQGYPGHARALTSYRLVDAMTLEIEWQTTVDAPCPVAPTQHAYFNLDPRDAARPSDAQDARGHRLWLAADQVLPVDDEGIPTGPPVAIDRSDTLAHDFRQPRRIDAAEPPRGHDHAYPLATPTDPEGLRPAARLTSRDGALSLDIATTLPALQVYTGVTLDGLPAPDGGRYRAHAGVALEPQYLPDGANHPEWPQPSCWVQPGQTQRHVARYRFSVAA